MSLPNSHNKQENGLLNILINVVIPVMILNKLSVRLGPAQALLLALSFPIAYGVWDFIKRHKTNWFSILGLINVSVTGSLALLGLDGLWFCIKEAIFPGLIGCFVIVSSFTNKPFVESLLMNPQLMDLDRISEKLSTLGNELKFTQHMKNSTRLLSISFFVSAVLNFVLAERIFIPLDTSLDATARSIALNEQIAQMTSYAMMVILLPTMLFLVFILWHLMKGIRKLTGLKTDEFLKS